MLSSATSTAWMSQHQRKGRREKDNDRSRAVLARSRKRSTGAESRGREVDAHSRPRAATFAGESLGGADRSGASARVGTFRRRCESWFGWNGETYLGGNANSSRDTSDAS